MLAWVVFFGLYYLRGGELTVEVKAIKGRGNSLT
jgi:hypothetical protein